jgi:hypothetical protein
MGVNRIGFGPYDQTHTPIPVALGSGTFYMIPAGQYQVLPGPYTFLQWYDPITTIWRVFQTPTQSGGAIISADGYNWRLANLTGCMVGVSVTGAGSGLTNGIYPAGTGLGTATSPSVTVSAGGGSVVATCNIIVGGAINSTVTITTAGAGYTRPPILLIDPPPIGGVPATAVCTLTTGTIGAVTVTNVGAGYKVAPKITIVPWPGDPAPTTAAVLTVNATLAGSGGITAMTVANPGATMSSVPTFTFSPTTGTPAATAIMCFTATTGAAQTNATHMGTGNIGFIIGATATAQSVNTNPAITTGLFVPRMGYTAFNTTSTGGVTFLDGGLHQIIPSGIAYATLSDGTISAAATAVAQTVGGANNDTSFLLPL